MGHWNNSQRRAARYRWIGVLAAVTAGTFAQSPAAWAHGAVPPWHWVVIERLLYSSSSAAPLHVTFATSPVKDHPTRSASFGDGVTGDYETRFHIRFIGPSPALGKVIVVRAGVSCSNDRTTQTRRYSWTAAAGRVVLLPASPLQDPPAGTRPTPAGVSCLWAFAVSSPTSSGRPHRLTVEVSALSPSASLVVGDLGMRYDLEECSIVVEAAGDQRTCRPLTAGVGG